MTKENNKQKVLIGLKKAHTSLGRIIEALSEDNTTSSKSEDKCFKIIQQNLSVIGLLKSVNIAMLENHIDLYIKEAKKGKMSKNSLDKMKDEILKTVRQAQNK
jgi:DNA-binding FrmR family transcriptional regulator